MKTEDLAQPEQEPVAWAMLHDNGDFIDAINPEEHARIEGDYKHALYTTPPQRKPLTDEQARSEFEAWHKDAYTQSLERYGHTYKNHHTRCRWQGWLAAHGIKGEA